MEFIDPKQIRKKAVSSMNQDGLTDIMTGIIMLALSVYFYLQVYHDYNLIVLLILPGLLVGPLIMNLRKKYTYPRTGYVNLKTKKYLAFKIALMVLCILLGILAFFVLFQRPPDLIETILPYFEYSPLMLGIFLLVGYLNHAFNYRLKRYFFYSFIAVFSILFSQLITDRRILSLIIMLFIQGLFFLPVGIFVFVKFLKNNPVQAEEDIDDNSENDLNTNLNKAYSLTYSDGWQEILTACFLLIWLIVILQPGLNNYWLYITILVNPLLLAFILTRIRKNRTFQLTMELTDARIDLFSFFKFFNFLFIFSLGLFVIISLKNSYSTSTLINFLPSILAMLAAIYYLLVSIKYRVNRFKLHSLVFAITGVMIFLLLKHPLYQLIPILLGPAVFLFIQGFRNRIKVR